MTHKFRIVLFLSIIGFCQAINASQTTDSLQRYNIVSATNAYTEFKILTYNTEWLSCVDNGPADETLQLSNIAKVIIASGADIVALQEVGTSTSSPTIDNLVKELGAIWEGKIVAWRAENCYQNQGIVYKKAKVQFVNASLISNGGSYSDWSSGRYPVLYNLNLLVQNSATPVSLINIHAKAYSDATSYDRRLAAANGLKTLLDGSLYNTKKIILAGDFNDYLIGSMCSTCGTSPYKSFMDDVVNYKGLTGTLKSPGYNNPVIDNFIISNELFPFYVTSSAMNETTATQTVSSYSSTTSDHTPVSIKLRIDPSQLTALNNAATETSISILLNADKQTYTVKSAEDLQMVRVLNINGIEILRQKEFSVDLSRFAGGVYFVQVKTTTGSKTFKIIKQ